MSGGPRRVVIVLPSGDQAIAGKSWAILLRGKPGTQLSFPVFMLTRMGQEVMSLLNVADEVQSLRELADRLDKSDLESIGLAQVGQLSGGQVTFKSMMPPLWQVTSRRKPLKKVGKPPFSAVHKS